jgi:hypothetical protein
VRETHERRKMAGGHDLRGSAALGLGISDVRQDDREAAFIFLMICLWFSSISVSKKVLRIVARN